MFIVRFILIAIGLLVIQAFNIEIEGLEVPQTHIGDSSDACNPASAPKVTNGFATYFSDNVYAC